MRTPAEPPASVSEGPRRATSDLQDPWRRQLSRAATRASPRDTGRWRPAPPPGAEPPAVPLRAFGDPSCYYCYFFML